MLFRSRGPFSFVLFVRSSTRASKHFGERNPGVSIILRARLFPRARVEAGLVAVPRVGSVRACYGRVGKIELARFLWVK